MVRFDQKKQSVKGHQNYSYIINKFDENISECLQRERSSFAGPSSRSKFKSNKEGQKPQSSKISAYQKAETHMNVFRLL